MYKRLRTSMLFSGLSCAEICVWSEYIRVSVLKEGSRKPVLGVWGLLYALVAAGTLDGGMLT